MTAEEFKSKGRLLILGTLAIGKFPLVEDSPQRTRVAMALMMGAILEQSHDKLTKEQHAKAWLASLRYLSDASDKEIISLLREGTAASVN